MTSRPWRKKRAQVQYRRFYQEDTVASAKDEHFTYDDVNRLATFTLIIRSNMEKGMATGRDAESNQPGGGWDEAR
jgi:hypothetical protein